MHQKGSYLELADCRLERRVTNEEVEKLVKVPLCCTHEHPKLRPNMVKVVGMLEGVTPLTEILNFLTFYSKRFSETLRIGCSNAQNNKKHSYKTS
ncbi:hypothetical protein NC651_011184 [Populus alba x Populus x berolinensis]|nr:hypothetical protein NC651_011184 [Populus alba x Populus x berolinensis]